ncbi:hypothetical protein HETIRDRAFT_446142 [Heterobasidion irregulare TC 32-1]|uniref:HNH nuclease domain-containing protein n=1 Tax=Heterobasidion irregulare (strain TC 32-1) TaxID=747525 RepID=W4JZF3_HETIT|nr:uncharacterized protein HETIRDRAFT_446142 [Heterobasidion irregulare TC 32-1]ETW78246.1 hypothetical protein HETIRDRAFT_446142 [Heterobasidion irregulare TC 32-1]
MRPSRKCRVTASRAKGKIFKARVSASRRPGEGATTRDRVGHVLNNCKYGASNAMTSACLCHWYAHRLERITALRTSNHMPSTAKNANASKKPRSTKRIAASTRNAAPVRTGELKEIAAQRKILTAKKANTRTASKKSFRKGILKQPIAISEGIHDQHSATPTNTDCSDIERCLLTLELPTKAAVKPCYVLNEHLWRNNKLLARLEWWWGMKYDSLELDGASNRIYLRDDWLESFDSGRWLLLPSFDVLDKIWTQCTDNSMLPENANRAPLEQIYDGAETFEYRLLPLDNTISSITRFDRPARSTNPRSKKTPASSCYSYPFDKLPTLVSHVKPHFVICDAGPKLAHRELEVLTPIACAISGLPETAAAYMLEIMRDAYYTWCQQAPKSMP